MKIRNAAGLVVLALSAGSTLASAEFTEATIYTEPHNAAAAFISTLHFMVGRMGRDCAGPLSKAESFPKEVVAGWDGRNGEYYEASTLYAGNVMSYYERTRGKDFAAAAMNEFSSSVQGQGAAVAQDMLSVPDKRAACTTFLARLDAGGFDITASRPFFKELTELVAIARAFRH